MRSADAPATETVVFDLDERMAGALCYVLGVLTGFFFYLLEEDNAFVRFHAAQSMLVFGGLFLLNLALNMLLAGAAVGTGGFVLLPVLGLLSTVIGFTSVALWIYLIIRAYQGRRVHVPVVGRIAENWV